MLELAISYTVFDMATLNLKQNESIQQQKVKIKICLIEQFY